LNSKKILEEVAKTGKCENLWLWDCQQCPLGKLKRRPDDSGWLSCYEAIVGQNDGNIEESDRKYKEKASEALADILLEEAIKSDN
jgi:hypothetical protein